MLGSLVGLGYRLPVSGLVAPVGPFEMVRAGVTVVFLGEEPALRGLVV